MKKVACSIVLLVAAAGCTRVAPHQRGRLAHPSMTQSSVIGPGEQHVRAVQEGAVGGSLDATSGCGCN
ncbi:MAG: hypothetical protein BGO98_00935 [Myxococcales bacterium 68-20]|nr:DUF4266 domain-containing protein [Myxococcales bacterium]OJY17495.1 MAG: hypothetical protein BGO98_00935 [Myxococcales bacterium 68-20]